MFLTTGYCKERFLQYFLVIFFFARSSEVSAYRYDMRHVKNKSNTPTNERQLFKLCRKASGLLFDLPSLMF